MVMKTNENCFMLKITVLFLHKEFTNPSLSCNFCYTVIMVSVANKKNENVMYEEQFREN